MVEYPAESSSSHSPNSFSQKMNLMNSTLPLACAPARWPDRIITPWPRFACGLWRLPRGDIAAAYCADTFPKVKVFLHDGWRFAHCAGRFHGPLWAEVDGYPLIPPDRYQGPEPAPYTYEGRTALHQGLRFKLGRKVVFVADDPGVEEWRRFLRVLYADGGMFTHGVNYLEFLTQRLSPVSVNERAAHELERAEFSPRLTPLTKLEMQRLLDTGDAPSVAADGGQQLGLGF